MSSFKNEIVKILDRMADIMEFRGENRFKVSAFRNGAETLRRSDLDIKAAVESGEIKNIKGIGKGLQSVISEYYDTGKVDDYEKMSAEIPPGIIDIMTTRGLGIKKIKMLYEELAVDTLDELEAKCNDGKVAALKGFGAKSQNKILEELARMKRNRGYMLLNRALAKTEIINDRLEKFDTVIENEITGQLKRVREVVKDPEIILLVKNNEEFNNELKSLYDYKGLKENGREVIYIGQEASAVKLNVYTNKSEYEKAKFELSCSEGFLSASGYDPARIGVTGEKEIFSSLGIPYVIPEMREKEYFSLPENLRSGNPVGIEDQKGFLHFHTKYSDGRNTLEEMYAAAIDYGYEYVAVCDHSQTAFYAGGLKEDRVLEQQTEIEELRNNGYKIFHGIESDILTDGSLDYSEEFLSNFQFVVASVHSVFSLKKDVQTARVIKAVENPFTDVLAHPTGRLLLARDGFDIDIKKVIDACAANDVAIEINANPHRLDFDWRNCYYAREKGCRISINADAHTTEEILNTEYGVMIARKTGITPGEVINCYDIEKFATFINRKVKRK